MRILFYKQFTGMKHDIVLNTVTGKISQATFNDDIFWSSLNFNDLFSHLNSTNIFSIEEKYQPLLEKLDMGGSEVEWKHLIGNERLKEEIKAQFDKIKEISLMFNKYYEELLPKRIRLFKRLKSFIFDGSKKERLSYAHHKTVTGRTVISSGMNLMTMKKEARSLLQSKHSGGSIIELDIKSLEPRLYLKLIKCVDVEDAYSFILEGVLEKSIESIPRKKIKLAFISLLYGAGEKKIKTMTGLNLEDIRKIKKYLNVAELKQKILDEFDKNGWFENAYGRKIFSVNAPINYYIQSTAADFACLLYEEFFSNLNTDGVDLIGVIHDAIILDVHPSAKELIMSVKSIHEPILNTTAYLNIEVHS